MTPRTMKALTWRRQGPAAEVLRIEELPVPEPGPGELLVRIDWSGVNPSDTKHRAGITGGPMTRPFVVGHHDGAGTVVARGARVPSHWLGRRVWTFFGAWQREQGTAAEYVALPLRLVQPLPDAVSTQVGASIGIPLMTAVHAVDSSGPLVGRHVLVTGGAGAVGHYAVQLARRSGARVATTARGDDKAAWAAEAGPHLVVDPREDGWLDRLSAFTGGQGFDVVIEVDAAGNAPHLERLLAFGGQVVVYGSGRPEFTLSYRGMMSRFATVRAFVVYLLPPAALRKDLRRMASLLSEGALRHPEPACFGMEDAARAHEHVEQGRGKALVHFGDAGGTRPRDAG